MSQEEEKLIEEFKQQKLKDLFQRLGKFCNAAGIDLKENEKIESACKVVGEAMDDLISKAYRAGKLAGFEIGAERVKKELQYFDFIIIANLVNEIFKSLIEEEKKKL